MKEFVLGFAYDDECILLIRKNRPNWQNGYLNGIGGHVEEGETLHEAMSREFNEETMGKLGKTTPPQWLYVCTFQGKEYKVHTFGLKMERLDQLKGNVMIASDEGLIQDYGFEYLHEHQYEMISNLQWLIPLVRTGSWGIFGKSIINEDIPETQGAEIV